MSRCVELHKKLQEVDLAVAALQGVLEDPSASFDTIRVARDMVQSRQWEVTSLLGGSLRRHILEKNEAEEISLFKAGRAKMTKQGAWCLVDESGDPTTQWFKDAECVMWSDFDLIIWEEGEFRLGSQFMLFSGESHVAPRPPLQKHLSMGDYFFALTKSRSGNKQLTAYKEFLGEIRPQEQTESFGIGDDFVVMRLERSGKSAFRYVREQEGMYKGIIIEDPFDSGSDILLNFDSLYTDWCIGLMGGLSERGFIDHDGNLIQSNHLTHWLTMNRDSSMYYEVTAKHVMLYHQDERRLGITSKQGAIDVEHVCARVQPIDSTMLVFYNAGSNNHLAIKGCTLENNADDEPYLKDLAEETDLMCLVRKIEEQAIDEASFIENFTITRALQGVLEVLTKEGHFVFTEEGKQIVDMPSSRIQIMSNGLILVRHRSNREEYSLFRTDGEDLITSALTDFTWVKDIGDPDFCEIFINNEFSLMDRDGTILWHQRS